MRAHVWLLPAEISTAPTKQLGAFVSRLASPDGHAVHTRSRLALGNVLTYVPGAQSFQALQLAELGVALNVSASHATHTRFVVALPEETSRSPGAHDVQSTHAVAEEASWSQVPPEQACLGAVPPAQNVPSSQAAHSVAVVEVPPAVCSLPAAQEPTGAQVASLEDDAYVPDSHAEHVRFVVGPPAISTWLPGSHVVQLAQLGAFVVALKLPLAQGAHVRSAVALPSAVTDCPGVHDVHAAHAVAESLSWSQLPLVQVSFGVVPPAQYVPVSQAAQTGGDVGVAGVVCSVPAAQASADTQLDWFGDEEYVPAPHAVHARSLVELGVVLTYVPAAHVLHASQLAALASALKLPLAHAVHVRSVVALPSADTACPGAHAVHGTHAVAALPSLSQVPLAQPSFGATSPAQ